MPMAGIPKLSTCPNTTNISDRPVHAKRNRLNYNVSEPGTKIGQPHYATPILVVNQTQHHVGRRSLAAYSVEPRAI